MTRAFVASASECIAERIVAGDLGALAETR
jgi:hypothetical protein